MLKNKKNWDSEMNDKTNQFITPLLTKFLSGYSVFILIGLVVSTIIVEAQENNHNVLTLERIYKDNEFSLKRFGPTRWLEDGSGYTTLEESAAFPMAMDIAKYDPESGMRTPEVNPEGYRQSAPINFAEGLKGDLLIIHGTGETNTHLEITEGLVDRLIELGKSFDYMTYPNRNHGIRAGKGTSLHLHMLMTRYLLTQLPPGPRGQAEGIDQNNQVER